MTMAWVLTQFDTAVNLDFATHIWIEGGVGRDWNGVAILKVSDSGTTWTTIRKEGSKARRTSRVTKKRPS